MPALQRAAPSRVITVSSGGMYTAKLDADDLQFEKMKEWDGVAAYAQTKVRCILLLPRQSVSVVLSADPVARSSLLE